MRRRTFLRSGAAALASSGAAALAGGLPADAAYAPLGEVEVDGATELVVDGTTGYVAVRDGFATVDLSDPMAPEVLAERRNLFADREGGPLRQIFDVKIDGDRLVVAGPAQGRGDLKGFGVYDVADPADPQLLGFRETNTGIHNCDISEGYVYITANGRNGNPLVVFDTTRDGFPEVGAWTPIAHRDAWREVIFYLRILHDVYVADGIAYCAYWDAGTFILDVSDPADPSFIARVGGISIEELQKLSGRAARKQYIDPPGNHHYPAIDDDGSLLGVGKESWDHTKDDGQGGPSGIDLYDTNDRTSPEQLSTIEPTSVVDATQTTGVTTTSHNFGFANERLYSSWYKDGVKLFDVADPANPELLAHWRDPDNYDFWTAKPVKPGEYFAASDYGNFRNQAAILTFPDAAGTQADQPSIGETPTPSSTPTTTATTPRTAGSPTVTASDPVTATRTASPATDTTTGAPGFGPIAALGGLSLAGWRLLRDRRE